MKKLTWKQHRRIADVLGETLSWFFLFAVAFIVSVILFNS